MGWISIKQCFKNRIKDLNKTVFILELCTHRIILQKLFLCKFELYFVLRWSDFRFKICLAKHGVRPRLDVLALNSRKSSFP